jgi:multiple sugar transport system ATP-binding protein
VAAIELQSVSKSYTEEKVAVKELSLEIGDGEFLVLVGPSGCGKSTLLRMIAGLETVTSGRILIAGRDVTEVEPRRRDIAMVFQSYALYPHMTVVENLSFGLRLAKVPKAERKKRVDDVMHLLRLEELGKRKPGQLSGGQRQRVAMGRAMVREPTAFLMDEPLSNLDAKLRTTMRGELARLHERLGVTTVYVTHDQTEAMTLGQRVAVIRDGVLQQVGTPQELFERPRNTFVAAFVGSPAINLVECPVVEGAIQFCGQRLPCPPDLLGAGKDRIVLGIRPTDLRPPEQASSDSPRVSGKILVAENLGAEIHVVFPVDGQPVYVDVPQSGESPAAGDERLLDAPAGSEFTAVLAGRQDLRPGREIELTFNIEDALLFDAASGEALERQDGRVKSAL